MAPNRGRATSHSTITPKRPTDLPVLNETHLATLEASESQPAASSTSLDTSSLSSPSLSLDGDIDEKAPGEDEEEEEEEDDDDDEADFQSQYSPQNAPFSSGSSSSSEIESESNHADEMEPPPPSGSQSQPQLQPQRLSRPFLHHSNSSHHLMVANSFAPPFYNRPPTPLPPSPSLTSLLRPSFSTTTSRPTTPDTSENDTPNDTEAAVAKSARTATTVPRASPKVPTYEYYGFVLYLTSSLVFLMYLLWSYLPSPFLHQLGIHYYPDRWWALAIPSFLVMTIIYIYVALASYNIGYLTLPMNSIENIVDDAADIAVIDEQGKIKGRDSRNTPSFLKDEDDAGLGEREGGLVGEGWTRKGTKWRGKGMDWSERGLWSEGTDAVMDVPVGGVCRVLYAGGGREYRMD